MLTINNLFNNENFKIKSIVIPEIQRDYVQGLEEYSYKLNNFLDVLFNALSSKDSKDMCSLDFIYGNIDTNGVFEPIDGQQRITTLALLYYYIEVIINKNYDNNIFKHISYKTKKTATDFCTLLNDKDFIDYLSNNKNMDINNAIKDYYKYYDIYNYDLTIESMINTLHLIQKKYKDISNISFDNITFQIFPMESFNLSDDLYIKMNGRGKQLSSFDNFKADYFKWLEDASNDNIDKLIPDSFGENSIDKLNTLKRKFNTDYIDIFWDYAFENSKGTSEAPDPEKLFFRFINRFVVGKYLLKGKNDEDFEKTFIDKGIKSEEDAVIFNNIKLYTKILNKQDSEKSYTYNYKMINILENLYNLQKCCSSNFKDILNFIFNPLWEVGEDEKLNIFPKENGLTYKHVLIFNAITSFLEQDSIIIDNIKCDVYNKIKEIFKNENNLSIHEECENNILMTLKRISRIVWNITEQYNLLHTINKDNYKTVISRLDFSKLGKLDNVYYKFQNICKNIDDEKPDEKSQDDNYNINKIIEDEVNKCQYIFEKPSLEQDFMKLEKLPYLKGAIGFLIQNYCKDSIIEENSKKYFSNKTDYKDFLIALISMVKNKEVLIKKKYRSDIVLDQLITENEMRDNACYLLKEQNIADIIKKKSTSKSEIKNKMDNYSNFTCACQHEALYRENLIDEYYIQRTSWQEIYWLYKNTDKATKETISFCPIRSTFVCILKSIANNSENITLEPFSKAYEDIYFQDNYKIFLNLYDIKIYFNNHEYTYFNLFNSMNEDINSDAIANINILVINLYKKLIESTKKIAELEPLSNFLKDKSDRVRQMVDNITI